MGKTRVTEAMKAGADYINMRDGEVIEFGGRLEVDWRRAINFLVLWIAYGVASAALIILWFTWA